MFTTLYLVIVIAHACGIHVTQAKPEAAFRKAINLKTRDYSSEAYSSYSSEEHHEHKDDSLEKQILAEIGIQSVPPQISKVIIAPFLIYFKIMLVSLFQIFGRMLLACPMECIVCL